MERYIYDKYYNSVLDISARKNHAKYFITYFRKCQKILDIGCGDGTFLKEVLKNNCSAYGIENCQNIINKIDNDKITIYKGNESNYMEFIRSQGRELVIISRKQ